MLLETGGYGSDILPYTYPRESCAKNLIWTDRSLGPHNLFQADALVTCWRRGLWPP